ncbi:argininosuccinate synthase domain-containing protein [Marinicella rhabdoformis]|uniref:argininosuccinate synthase domain-containing protein n=1 Tax=Marinicella rhabdoformis TaxID=2580566 RepID=UPI0012AECAE8|nr:argininosuccinate synthase domain-containing protein [Marinicella rhabdoformis]
MNTTNKTSQSNSIEKDTIVLAFSGGLDTSFCLHQLKQSGHQVHTVFVNSGGLSDGLVNEIADRATELGSDCHQTIDASQEIWQEFVVPLIWSRAKMRDDYPLLCSDRYVIVKLCLAYCDQIGTQHIAHGCTVMGNDQFRFDQTILSLGSYQIHAPIRDLQASISGNIRDHELQVLADAGFETTAQHQQYSINENLLGVTISGSEIDQFQTPQEGSACWVKPRAAWPDVPLNMSIGFEQGEAVSLNGEKLAGADLLAQLNQAFAAYGVGRHIYTGDVSIGIKGRIVFECPGIDALMAAHKALEDVVNSKLQNQFRHQMSERWAELVYQGFFYEPHKNDIEAYLASSQSHVTGEVQITTQGGDLLATAVQSPWIIQDSDAVYAQSCSWSPEQAVGYIKLTGQSSVMANKVRRKAS